MLNGRNAHELLPLALDLLFKRGVARETRNGSVLQLEGPTLIHYERPLERVLFHPERNANPFFHLFEALWMLAGRRDVAFPAHYAKQIKAYSDDGVTLNGAYGYRWRCHFGHDQLDWIVDALRTNPNCRRQVLTMWDGGNGEGDDTAQCDLAKTRTSLDVPCNTHAYFSINGNGQLDMTVCNRSNDLIWGALGANAVHFSVLLEYMAARIGVPVGSYYQFTNNLHGYLKTVEPLWELAARTGEASPYELGQTSHSLLIPAGEEAAFENDLSRLGYADNFESSFFRGTVAPMLLAHKTREMTDIEAPDWRKACAEWLGRRKKVADDGVIY